MKSSPKDKMAAAVIRQQLLARNLKRADLGRLVGLKVTTLSNVIGGNSRSPTMRRKVEAALGMPVWSTPEEFATRHTNLATAQPTTPASP